MISDLYSSPSTVNHSFGGSQCPLPSKNPRLLLLCGAGDNLNPTSRQALNPKPSGVGATVLPDLEFRSTEYGELLD